MFPYHLRLSFGLLSSDDLQVDVEDDQNVQEEEEEEEDTAVELFLAAHF
jgi:hypothetical protein